MIHVHDIVIEYLYFFTFVKFCIYISFRTLLISGSKAGEDKSC